MTLSHKRLKSAAFLSILTLFPVFLTSAGKYYKEPGKKEGITMKPAPVKKNKAILGILLVIAGAAGLMLPVLPGWLLILAGLALTGRGR